MHNLSPSCIGAAEFGGKGIRIPAPFEVRGIRPPHLEQRLGYPRFTQRSIRRFHIGRLWRSGVDRKLISKWQGHCDGGKLIIDTYTEVLRDDDITYEQQQFAKLQRAA